MSDARNNAWMSAWEIIENAAKYRVQWLKNLTETRTELSQTQVMLIPLPQHYWAMMAEAAVFADLARADTIVGIISGDQLDDLARRESEESNMTMQMMDDLRKKMDE